MYIYNIIKFYFNTNPTMGTGSTGLDKKKISLSISKLKVLENSYEKFQFSQNLKKIPFSPYNLEV